ncbi:LPXTG-motif cell wall anchor domain-containing protein OS=Streptomyces microflavus OX=1919 GN=Smic_29770 PE=4 SV=1 [Streptomyces microflavus]
MYRAFRRPFRACPRPGHHEGARPTAPAEAKVGDEIEVVWKTVEAASKNPDVLDLGKDTVKPTGTITLGGAASGELKLEGPRQNPPIPKNSPMLLPDMTAKLKLETAGEITLTPGAYNINVSKPISTDTKCAPKEAVQPGATIKVTAEGSSTGGTTSGGTDSGGTTTGGTDSGRHD